MSLNGEKSIRGGFWKRFAAVGIDIIIIYLSITIIEILLRQVNVYLPFELSFIVLALLYPVVLTGWKGQTIGKALCGLTVKSTKDKPIGYLRAFLREIVGKFISGILLLTGFFWIGISKTKRGFHDYIAQTRVVQDPAKLGRSRALLVIVLFIIIVSVNPIQWISDYHSYTQMAIDGGEVVTTYSQRDPSSLVDVHLLESADLSPFVRWLGENSKNPIEYAVETAAKYQITIFGELHWLKDNLTFFNEMIPDLYHRAGVTCIALEACLPEDNAKLVKLVTSNEFNHELAMEIARNGDAWKNWGWKGYWDVFESVWRVNRDLPENKKKMRVVGIGIKFDGPSFALTGIGELTVHSPAWEKLRIFRIIDDIAQGFIMGESLYAANVARETIEKGERGVVLVGSAHASINSLWSRKKARMGFLLHRKYGDRVFQINFHNYPVGYHGAKYLPISHILIQFIEKVASERKNTPFGFEMKESPFGNLYDSKAYFFRDQPGLCLSDITAGYIYLKPVAEQKRCEWLNGYITKEMFAKHKNYYEAKTGKKLNTPEEAEKAFSAYEGW